MRGVAGDENAIGFFGCAYYFENKGKVISRSKLLLEVWDINFDTGTNVVDTYISYLRRKVHTDTFQGIKTVRGIGFQMIEGK